MPFSIEKPFFSPFPLHFFRSTISRIMMTVMSAQHRHPAMVGNPSRLLLFPLMVASLFGGSLSFQGAEFLTSSSQQGHPSLCCTHATLFVAYSVQTRPCGNPSERCLFQSQLMMGIESPEAGGRGRPHTFIDVDGEAGRELQGKGLSTRYANAGRRTQEFSTDSMGRSIVNVPVFRASTVTFPSRQAMRDAQTWGAQGVMEGLHYGRYGTLTQRSLEDAYAHLQGGFKACAMSTPLAASISSILSSCQHGKSLAVSDDVSGGVKFFCDKGITRLGVKCIYFAKVNGQEQGPSLEDLLKSGSSGVTTVYVEGPVAPHFRVGDVPAICRLSKNAGAQVIFDNTWAGPVNMNPFEHGVDICIVSAGMLSGSPLDELGLVAGTKRVWRRVLSFCKKWGTVASPEVSYATLRGIRTFHFRGEEQDATAQFVAAWMEETQGDVVERVWHPCLESHPDHQTWSRLYTGSGPLFGFTLRKEFWSDDSLSLLMDQLCVLRIGAATGGEESCLWPHSVEIGGPELGNIVMYVGLEDSGLIVRDLREAFQRIRSGR